MQLCVLRRLVGVPCWQKDWTDVPCVCQQTFNLRVSVIVVTAVLLVSRLRGSACGESDSDVACGGPFSLSFVRFLCDNYNDVTLCVSVH